VKIRKDVLMFVPCIIGVHGGVVVEALYYKTGRSRVRFSVVSLRSHYGPGVDSASNRNEYQKHFLVVKATGA
jgi:hypothetical protein